MILKKPYIKKIDKIAQFDVWLVDGKYIRKNFDEEFGDFGQHYHFKFIPKNEFWIDHEHTSHEINFFIHHLLRENRLMAKGLSYDKALEKADDAEKRERSKVDFIKKDVRFIHKAEKIRRVHKKLLKSYSKYLQIWLVHGDAVRDLFFVDFTEGGHDKVYHFVPAKEVWIDDSILRTERRYMLFHELHERHLMARGKSYDEAHRSASRLEYDCRHRPEKLKEKLKEAVEQNKE